MLIRTLSLLLFSGLAFAASSFPVLTYSTYLRDSFTPKAIATDASGNVYMAGNAIVDPGASQSTVLVVKLNAQATSYLYVRYLGGSVNDSANAIAVDAAGDVYVAGSTASPDFPVTSGGNLGTASTGMSSRRSFVAKFDANGELVFSDLLGGSAASNAQAVAVTASGQVVVSGLVSGSAGPAFPSTAGAYSVTNTANHPYLLELDPSGTKVVFSATGIGGSALAVDSTGNIYVAGSTLFLDYPTTPGAYQATFPGSSVCFTPPCSLQSQGANQYVTKVDPTGSKLIYSTAVTGSQNTTNGGMAVDAAGNVYLTGYAGADYPYTVTPPAIPIGPVGNIFFFELPFLSKLDAAGKTLLFSVPLGGSGVQVDAHGAVYAGGGVGSGLAGSFTVPSIPAVANIPAQCLPDNSGSHSAGYVAQVDAASGSLMGTQFIGGSTLAPSAVALAGSTLWIAGATALSDFPFTPNALTLPSIPSTPLPGAYLGGVDFSQPQPPAGTPQVFCILDSANLASVGPAGRNQLLTMIGTGLGPSTGVGYGDNSTTLGGATIRIGSVSAPLLYVSSSQINFAVPAVDSSLSFAPMQVTVNGSSAPSRLLPLTYNPNLSVFTNTAVPAVSGFGPVSLALNADGSMNSASNPAKLGSVVSVFVNGFGVGNAYVATTVLTLSTINGWSVINITPPSPFVSRVDLRVPSPLVNNFFCPRVNVCGVGFTLSSEGFLFAGETPSPSEAFGGLVYVDRGQ